MEISKRTVAIVPRGAGVRPGALVVGADVLLAALLGLLSPALAFWVLLGGVALVLAAAAPWLVLCLVPPAVALDTVIELHLGPLRAGPTDVLVGALIVGSLWRALTAGERAAGGRWPLMRWPRWWAEPAARAVACALGAYLLIVVLSVAVASDHSAALKEALKWAEVLILFALGAGELAHADRRRAVIWIVILTGVVEALIGYGQWVLATGELGAGGASVRVVGTFGQPNPFAAFLNLALPLALALAVLGGRVAERWLAAGAAVLLLGAQALAASRGGLLGLAAALVVMAVLALGIWRPAVVAGGAVAVLGAAAWALGLVPVSLRDRLLHALRLDNVSLTGPVNDANFSSVERLAHWAAGWRMFLAHPLLGVGAGNYAAAYPRYKIPDWNQALGHAHNYYINAAAETGALGLLALLAVVAAGLWLVWRAAAMAREAVAPAQRSWRGLLALRGAAGEWWLGVGLSGVVAAVVVHSTVDDLFVHGMELQLALLLAVAAALLAARRRAAAGT